MTISSDGCLYFGFLVGDEDEPPEWLISDDDDEDETKDFDTFICDLADVSGKPYAERKVAIDACPADLYKYCSYDYPMYILGLRGEELTVARGHTEIINLEALQVSKEKIAAFKSWCEQNNIPYEEPKWILCSMYG